jgi:hypothetical protein
MAFKVTQHSETNKWVEAGETMWLTADRERLVPDGSPEAAFLFSTPGKRISVEEAQKYGLVKGKAKPADKQKAKAEDKQAKPAANKSRKQTTRKRTARKRTARKK